MHWNEQQTSTNWRLDRIRIWSWWSELMKYIVYLLTIVLPAIKRVPGDTFVFQWDSAPAHRRTKQSNCWSAKPQILSLRVCTPPQQPWPQSGRLQALGDHPTAGLSDDVQECGWTQEAIWIGLEQNITDTASNAWRNRLRACVRTKSRHNRTFTVGSWTTGHLDKLSARVTEM